MKHLHDGEVIALPDTPVLKLIYAQQGKDRLFEFRGIVIPRNILRMRRIAFKIYRFRRGLSRPMRKALQ